MEYGSYFEYRQIDPGDYRGFKLPVYLKNALGANGSVRILDFGGGFGQMSNALREAGYKNVELLDISPPALAHSRSIGLTCHDGNEPCFFETHQDSYDFVILSHVVEHFPKDEVISILAKIRDILKPGGGVIVMVPNAQSNTGAYWAYEDFTHYTMFTSGSLYYVLRAAGFEEVVFLDPDCLDGSVWYKKFFRKILLKLYRANYGFWNKVTGSSTHIASPLIFSYEVKALGRR
jgi:2-polyprenyl-3-methyl-5-hydroxy-6-metoxy-1,4-benzoquinol methylase